jgi:signal transduction histidine kinase
MSLFYRINQKLDTIISQRSTGFLLMALHLMLVSFDQNASLRNFSFLLCALLIVAWQSSTAPSQLQHRQTNVLIQTQWQWTAFSIVTLLLMWMLNWWLTALMMCLLFGMVGGRILSKPDAKNRIVHMLAATYLLSMLLLWIIPKLLHDNDNLLAAEYVVAYFMPALPLAIALLEHQNTPRSEAPIFDFFYALILSMLAIIIVLASFIIGGLKQVDYLLVMSYAVTGMALILFGFSFFWRATNRFSGAEVLMSRYLLSVGMPFEQWVKTIATLAELESEPNQFIEASMQSMMRLEWVAGVTWQTDDSEGSVGNLNKDHSTAFQYKDFAMTVSSNWPISPALYVHTHLLTQIMGEFYLAKRREMTLQQNTYMQAFYETGSRLTHDIKNILQSLSALIGAAQQVDAQNEASLIQLIQRQLPLLNHRISATLDKLSSPSADKKRLAQFTAWWKMLCLRYGQPFITFQADDIPNREINAEVLDSMMDCLLSNAIEKSKHETQLLIQVSLKKQDEGYVLSVQDNGSSIPATISKKLFQQHISASNGLGVGLYHAAQDAEQAGYRLSLASNKKGQVRFDIDLF